MAIYRKALQKLIKPGPTDPRVDVMVGTVAHVAVSMADSLHDWFDGPSGGVESHFYIRLDGVVEQYRDTAYEADAQGAGNSWLAGGKRYGFISYETEGMGSGKWSAAQLASIKELILWGESVHHYPMVKATSPHGPGHGYHALFDAWNRDHHACPGADRIKQFNNELVPWLATGGSEDDMYSDDDRKRDVATHDRVFGMLNQRYYAPDPKQPGAIVSVAEGKGTPARALDTLDGNYLVQRQARLEAKVDGLTAALKAIASQGSSIDLDAVVRAVDAAVDNAFDERVESSKIVLDVSPAK